MKLSEIAKQLDCELRGDGSIEIKRAATIAAAVEGDISFLANPKYRDYLQSTNASAIVLAEDDPWDKIPSLRSADPYLLFSRIIDLLYPSDISKPGLHPSAQAHSTARIDKTATIGELSVVGSDSQIDANTTIAAQVYVGKRVRIGKRCHLYPGVIVLDDCQLGDDVILNAGVVIGSDGFGFASSAAGHKKTRQIGNVVIENNVEIGANSCVDRAALGSTIIGAGTKIDNLVQIAHNVEIGQNCLIVSQVGISGSTKLGNWVTLAGQVGVVGHLNLGDRVVGAAQSGISKDIPAGMVVLGSPANELRKTKRITAHTRRLPELVKRVKKLEVRLAQLEESNQTLDPNSGQTPQD